jgi:3-deoxy-manno-octulosonate cytidylyltransferase (CMP-KDO synthetase)
MVVKVLERVLLSHLLGEAFVATDSEEIFQAVEKSGGKALMTSPDHPSGTDRVAEAAAQLGMTGEDIVVNVQGDQPLLDPFMIEQVVGPLIADPGIPMSTLIYRIVREQEITHPNAVKTVFDDEGFALYFSRATIPYFREGDADAKYYKHHGIYAYRNDFLQQFSRLPKGTLESAERLEQLRALEYGFRMKVVITKMDSIEVDTPEDLERVRLELSKEDLTIKRQ